MLNILYKSPFKYSSSELLGNLCDENDALLLAGDGVYGVNHPAIEQLSNVYALAEDCSTRGIQRQSKIQYIDYVEMVALTEQHNPIITWR